MENCEDITYLPIIGEALSYGNKKQRGGKSLYEIQGDTVGDVKQVWQKNGYIKAAGHIKFKRDCPILTAQTILKHPKASEKQKGIAKMYLDDENCPEWVESMIVKIKVSLYKYR